jgi:hypothetical protein
MVPLPVANNQYQAPMIDQPPAPVPDGHLEVEAPRTGEPSRRGHHQQSGPRVSPHCRRAWTSTIRPSSPTLYEGLLCWIRPYASVWYTRCCSSAATGDVSKTWSPDGLRAADADIQFFEGGDWDKLGRGCLWNGEIQNCIHQNHIFRVRVKEQAVLPEFLSAMVSSPAGKAYFQAASKQTTNLASINQRQLKAFPVPVLPVAQQRAIIAELNDVAACVARLRLEQLDAGIEHVMPAVLDTAFSGEL